MATSPLDYLAFDCDNHYYEAHDAFTRHVPKRDAAALRAVGRDRRPQVPHRGREARARGREPDLESDREARRDVRVLPRQPERPQSARDAARPRAAARALHGPRRARRGDRRAGPRGGVAVPDAGRALRGAAQARHRGGGDARAARSTAGSRRTGACNYKGRIFARALHLAGRPRLRVPRARVGARAGRARGGDAARGGLDRARPALARRPDASTRSGRAPPRPASPSSCTRATRATRTHGYARDGFAPSFDGATTTSRR